MCLLKSQKNDSPIINKNHKKTGLPFISGKEYFIIPEGYISSEKICSFSSLAAACLGNDEWKVWHSRKINEPLVSRRNSLDFSCGPIANICTTRSLKKWCKIHLQLFKNLINNSSQFVYLVKIYKKWYEWKVLQMPLNIIAFLKYPTIVYICNHNKYI